MEKYPECERADEFKGQKGGAGDHEEWRQVPRTQRPWCSLPFTLKNKGSSPFKRGTVESLQNRFGESPDNTESAVGRANRNHREVAVLSSQICS